MVRTWLPLETTPGQVEDLVSRRDAAVIAGETHEAAQTDWELAHTLYSQTQFGVALPTIEAAIERFRSVGDSDSIARCLAFRGVILIELKRYEAASRSLDEAWLAFLECGSEIDTPQFDYAWARCLVGSADYPEALRRFITALDGAIERQDTSLAAASSMAIGEVLSLLGRHAEAVEFVDGARRAYATLQNMQSAAQADRFAAHLLVSLGRRKAAVKRYETAFEGFVETAGMREASEVARELGRLLADIGTRDMDASATRAALENLHAALAGFQSLELTASAAGTQRDIAETLVDLGAIELDRTHIELALTYFESAVFGFAAIAQPLSATAAARRLAYALELLDLPHDSEALLRNAFGDADAAIA